MILYNDDCLKVLPTIPDNSIDLVLTDPPYGTTECKWDSIVPLDKLWKELKRIRKDNKLICYDSYWYDGKFSKSPRTCVEVEKSGRELYISKDNLYKDTKGERFYVFIPKDKSKIK